jgi:hypothetical protein
MGNTFSDTFSNRSVYISNPNYVILEAFDLQRYFFKHKNNARIIPMLKEYPVATNYCFDIFTRDARQTDYFNSFDRSPNALWVHIGTLRFNFGCQIVLTKAMHSKILEFNKLDPIPLSKDDQLQISDWTIYGINFLKK